MIRLSLAVACAAGAIMQVGGPALADSLLRADGYLLKWISPSSGTRTVVTYAVVSDAFTVPADKKILSPDNCGSMQAFADVVAASPNVSIEQAKQELEAAFKTWENAAALSFIEIDDVKRANIVVGAAHSSQGRAFANLSVPSGQTQRPTSMGLGTPEADAPHSKTLLHSDGSSFMAIDQAYVCLSPRARWKVGFDGNTEVYDLRYTFTHEIGHAIGLDHPGRSGAIMGYRYEERVQPLTALDLSAVRKLYGSP